MDPWYDLPLAQDALAKAMRNPPPEVEVTAKGDPREVYDIYYGPLVDQMEEILDAWFARWFGKVHPFPSFPDVQDAIDAVLGREPSFRGKMKLDAPKDWRGVVVVREKLGLAEARADETRWADAA